LGGEGDSLRVVEGGGRRCAFSRGEGKAKDKSLLKRRKRREVGELVEVMLTSRRRDPVKRGPLMREPSGPNEEWRADQNPQKEEGLPVVDAKGGQTLSSLEGVSKYKSQTREFEQQRKRGKTTAEARA